MHGSIQPGRSPATLRNCVSLALAAATLASGPGLAGPFFSEYVEGTSNNKALEIYNPGPGSFDLAGCQIRMYFNGSASFSAASLHTFAAGAVVAEGGTYTLAHPSAVLTGATVNATTSFAAWFNGDDAVALVCAGSTLDVVGTIGADPGSEWGTGLVSTADNTLRRKATVTTGDTNGADAFDPSAQWEGYATDTFGGLGSHAVAVAGPGIAGSVPAEGATDVALALGSIQLSFSEPLSETATDPAAWSVRCPGGGTGYLSGSPSVDYAAGTATLPVSALPAGTACQVVLPAGSLVGATSGLANAADLTLGFNTVEALAACGSAATAISAIQGSGTASPLDGSTVTLEGVVVGDYQATDGTGLSGFFVQEEDGHRDGNPMTSEGIFVFRTVAAPDVAVGDIVRVTGQVEEYFGMTELDASTGSVLVCDSGASVTPAEPSLPVPIVPTGDLTVDTGAIDAYYEPFEGMLVTFPETLSVAEYFELERYGQIVLSQGGRIPTFTAASEPSAAGYIDHQIDLARRTLILDDLNNSQNSALVHGTALPYPYDLAQGILGLSTTDRFRGGDTVSDLTGVLHWSWAGQSGTDAWRIRPVRERYGYTFDPANPRPETAPDVGGSLKVASFNVLNYFTTVDTTASNSSGLCGPSGTQDCRGADSAAELARQRDKAAAALCGMDADIVGLMEIENNATASLGSLVDALSAVGGCGPYSYVNTGTIGSDAIKVGLLYKTDTVEPVGGHAILTSSVDPRFLDTKNRPALAQTFREKSTGETLTVAVNHLKSKGSDCNDVGDEDLGDGQGNCNATRTAAAQALADWLEGRPTGTTDPDVLIVGDLNSYAMEDPIAAIEGAGYTNLVAELGGAGVYGYVFDGQTGYLDHALANAALKPQVAGLAEWHINADEPPAFDYNDTIRDTGESSFEARPAALPLYLPDERRTSDHDPILIGLDLATAAAPGDLNGDRSVNIDDWNVLKASLGKPAALAAPGCDLDGDGRITVLDSRRLVLLCTKPQCAR